jgi:hypothetical protein
MPKYIPRKQSNLSRTDHFEDQIDVLEDENKRDDDVVHRVSGVRVVDVLVVRELGNVLVRVVEP